MREKIETAERAHLECSKVTGGRVLEGRLLQILFADTAPGPRMAQSPQRLPSPAEESVRHSY